MTEINENNIKEILHNIIELTFEGLREREKKVLILRYGIQDGRLRTLEEIGKEFKVTRERVRQIWAKGLRKLKHPSRNKSIQLIDEVFNYINKSYVTMDEFSKYCYSSFDANMIGFLLNNSNNISMISYDMDYSIFFNKKISINDVLEKYFNNKDWPSDNLDYRYKKLRSSINTFYKYEYKEKIYKKIKDIKFDLYEILLLVTENKISVDFHVPKNEKCLITVKRLIDLIEPIKSFIIQAKSIFEHSLLIDEKTISENDNHIEINYSKIDSNNCDNDSIDFHKHQMIIFMKTVNKFLIELREQFSAYLYCKSYFEPTIKYTTDDLYKDIQKKQEEKLKESISKDEDDIQEFDITFEEKDVNDL